MSSKTFTDLSMRKNAKSKGFMRTMYDRMVEGRQRQARRYIEQNFALHAVQMDDATRGTLFEGDAPRR